jgi:hypothetical protein
MAGAYDGLLTGSGVDPGMKGWLTLDEAGVPSAVTVLPPEVGTPAIPIIHNTIAGFDALLTPTGAAVTAVMNPHPDRRFVLHV